MKQLLVSGLSLLLLASATARPAELLQVSPPEESIQTDVQYVGALFELGDESEITSVQLLVDGVNVTNLSTIGSTRDGCFPPSRGCPAPSQAGISYTPNGLEPGLHYAEIRLNTQENSMKSYQWSFSIKSP